jgi:hypothetical protein
VASDIVWRDDADAAKPLVSMSDLAASDGYYVPPGHPGCAYGT